MEDIAQEDIAAGKQGTRASPGVLVGYDGPYKYILYHWTNRSFKVYRDQDVVFMEQVFPFQLGRIPSLMPFSAKDLLVRPPVAFDPGVFDPVLAAAQPLALAPPLVAASLPPAAEEVARPLAPPLVVALLLRSGRSPRFTELQLEGRTRITLRSASSGPSFAGHNS